MKKKYLIGIIIIAIIVFVVIEFFRSEEKDDTISSNITSNVTGNTISNTTSNVTSNTTEATTKDEEITNSEELLEKADTILIARGWAGASNNKIILKNGTLYHYDNSSKKITKLATGIEKIYYETDQSEEITAQKGNNANIIDDKLTFIIYK